MGLSTLRSRRRIHSAAYTEEQILEDWFPDEPRG